MILQNNFFQICFADLISNDAYGISETPVVLSRGIFSEISAMQEFGLELVEEGHDSWLIEMVGGPTLECDDCPNYKYEDLVHNYWPTSIAAIQKLSDSNKINYIGHSNGCRAALSSLNEYSQNEKSEAGHIFNFVTRQWEEISLSSEPVDKFFGIGCPVLLNEETPFTEAIRATVTDSFELERNNLARFQFDRLKNPHLYKYDFLRPLYYELVLNFKNSFAQDLLYRLGNDNQKISRNLFEFYINLSMDPQTNNEDSIVSEENSYFRNYKEIFAKNKGHNSDFSNIKVNKLYMYATSPHDMMVPIEDSEHIVNLTDGEANEISMFLIGSGFYSHGALTKRNIVRNGIREELKKKFQLLKKQFIYNGFVSKLLIKLRKKEIRKKILKN